ncbi:MAG TPA: hypothetical protein VFC00_23300 [Micromonosporaceae bacterium]|nr:hypothetical protein [Micromonosporaceae bacterium]
MDDPSPDSQRAAALFRLLGLVRVSTVDAAPSMLGLVKADPGNVSLDAWQPEDAAAHAQNRDRAGAADRGPPAPSGQCGDRLRRQLHRQLGLGTPKVSIDVNG